MLLIIYIIIPHTECGSQIMLQWRNTNAQVPILDTLDKSVSFDDFKQDASTFLTVLCLHELDTLNTWTDLQPLNILVKLKQVISLYCNSNPHQRGPGKVLGSQCRAWWSSQNHCESHVQWMTREGSVRLPPSQPPVAPPPGSRHTAASLPAGSCTCDIVRHRFICTLLTVMLSS